MLPVGAAVAWFVGSVILFAVRVGPRELIEPLLLLSLAIGGLPTIWLACRRGRLARAKSFLVGYAGGFCVFGGVMLLLPGGRMQQSIAATLAASGFLLWPPLLTILALQNFWSWDDAFPQVVSHARYAVDNTAAHAESAAMTAEEGGIDFPEEPSGAET